MTEPGNQSQTQNPESASTNGAARGGASGRKAVTIIALLAIIAAGIYLTFARIKWRDEAELRNQALLREQILQEQKQAWKENSSKAKSAPRPDSGRERGEASRPSEAQGERRGR